MLMSIVPRSPPLVHHVEIVRAVKILKAMGSAHGSHKGAIGLSVNGRDEMVDAPMLRQVRVPHFTLGPTQ